MMRSLTGFIGVFLFALVVSCDDPAPDLTEWTVADHHNQGSQPKAQQRRQPGKAPTYARPSKRNPLVEVTWLKQCSNCHGKRGKGDGPESAMVKARDLTTQEWQASVSDEQILEVIKNGKGKMPSFTFPESMLTSLVAHVRALPQRGKSPLAAAAASAGGAAGAGGAGSTLPAADEDDEAEADEGSAAGH